MSSARWLSRDDDDVAASDRLPRPRPPPPPPALALALGLADADASSDFAFGEILSCGGV
jgi:hypothetical protein